jgi:hypothetical protein
MSSIALFIFLLSIGASFVQRTTVSYVELLSKILVHIVVFL